MLIILHLEVSEKYSGILICSNFHFPTVSYSFFINELVERAIFKFSFNVIGKIALLYQITLTTSLNAINVIFYLQTMTAQISRYP